MFGISFCLLKHRLRLRPAEKSKINCSQLEKRKNRLNAPTAPFFFSFCSLAAVLALGCDQRLQPKPKDAFQAQSRSRKRLILVRGALLTDLGSFWAQAPPVSNSQAPRARCVGSLKVRADLKFGRRGFRNQLVA